MCESERFERNGRIEWCDKNGLYHRTDGPAIEQSDGGERWYIHGVLHREGGPARIDPDGYKEWMFHGGTSNDGGPAVINRMGRTWWYFNGERLDEDEEKFCAFLKVFIFQMAAKLAHLTMDQNMYTTKWYARLCDVLSHLYDFDREMYCDIILR